MREKILIIEDDLDIVEMVRDYLSKEEYEVYIENDGDSGVRCLKKESIDLILLDVMMKGLDEYQTLNKIRAFSQIPVMMVTARGAQLDKVKGFKNGCDDYITKPFDLVELSLRINAILRRAVRQDKVDNSKLTYKDLIIDINEFKVLKQENEIKLTKKEFEILKLLIENKGRVYTTENIYTSIWKDEYLPNDNTVITHIRNLREKIGDKVKDSIYIKTIWGVGYKIEKDS
ncbi:MAG: response regulator transcription factor [Sarcina sp.]